MQRQLQQQTFQWQLGHTGISGVLLVLLFLSVEHSAISSQLGFLELLFSTFILPQLFVSPIIFSPFPGSESAVLVLPFLSVSEEHPLLLFESLFLLHVKFLPISTFLPPISSIPAITFFLALTFDSLNVFLLLSSLTLSFLSLFTSNLANI